MVYYYDSILESWVLVTSPDHHVLPLEGYYVKMLAEGLIPIISDPEPTVPPSKNLSAGLNLTGLAAMKDMGVESALASIYMLTENLTGYIQIVNPPINTPNDWVNNLYIRDGSGDPTMMVGKAYWVVMINPGTLYGFTLTPIP